MRLNIDLLVVLPLAVPPASVPIECLNLGVQSSPPVVPFVPISLWWGALFGRIGERKDRIHRKLLVIRILDDLLHIETFEHEHPRL
jgi:hypothetical protein